MITFEIAIDDKFEKKSKSVIIKVDIVDHEDQVTDDIDDNFIKFIAMLTKNFRKTMRRLDRRTGNNKCQR